MDLPGILQIYKEASSCLETVAEGLQKESTVDTQMMIEECTEYLRKLNKLRSMDVDQCRQMALDVLQQRISKAIDIMMDSGQTSPVRNEPSPGRPDGKNEQTKDEENNRRQVIEETIIPKGSIGFSDVAGLSDAKQALKEAIIMPLQYPQLFTGGRKPWRCILLYGPPGTGKSRLAQAVSSEIDSNFYSVSSSDLVSRWFGESEKLIKELFVHAKQQAGRSVIFIDEIDSICRQRSSREEESTRRIKTELLKQMEGVGTGGQEDQLFLLCATNCPWELDTAFLRRFQKRIYISLPDREARVTLIKIHCRDNSVHLTDEDWQLLAERTHGQSGSDISNLVLDALFQPIRELQQAQYWTHNISQTLVPCSWDQPGAIKANLKELPSHLVETRGLIFEDFLQSLTTNRPTVTQAELDRFASFTRDFGQSG